MLAAALLTLCVGLQVLEATGRWDRTFQDSGDEAAIVTIVLCVGAALLPAIALRRRLTPASVRSSFVRFRSRPVSYEAPLHVPASCASPPHSLRI